MRDVIKTEVPGLVLVPKERNPSYYHLITGWGTPLAWCTCEIVEGHRPECPVIRQWFNEQENSSERIPG